MEIDRNKMFFPRAYTTKIFENTFSNLKIGYSLTHKHKTHKKAIAHHKKNMLMILQLVDIDYM